MRYFIGFLVTIGLIVLIIVLLLSGRGGKGNHPLRPLNLGDYSTSSSSVQLVTDGPIVADQDFRSVKIAVSQSTVDFTLYQGYQGNVIASKSYPNNDQAYGDFLQALQHGGFTLYNLGVTSDERGYCPTGERFVLTLKNNDNDVRRSWTTSCGSSVKGSFAGPIDLMVQLFSAQVPAYNDLVSGVNF